VNPKAERAVPNKRAVLCPLPSATCLLISAGVKRTEAPSAVLTDEVARVVFATLVAAHNFFARKHLLQMLSCERMHAFIFLSLNFLPL